MPLLAPRWSKVIDLRCPYCHATFRRADETWRCASCRARHHLECAFEHGSCSVHGCASSPVVAVEAPRVPVRGWAALVGALAAALLLQGIALVALIPTPPSRTGQVEPDPVFRIGLRDPARLPASCETWPWHRQVVLESASEDGVDLEPISMNEARLVAERDCDSGCHCTCAVEVERWLAELRRENAPFPEADWLKQRLLHGEAPIRFVSRCR